MVALVPSPFRGLSVILFLLLLKSHLGFYNPVFSVLSIIKRFHSYTAPFPSISTTILPKVRVELRPIAIRRVSSFSSQHRSISAPVVSLK
jgi:hypothetical protein